MMFEILTKASILSTYFSSQAWLPHLACQFLKHEEGEHVGFGHDYKGEEQNGPPKAHYSSNGASVPSIRGYYRKDEQFKLDRIERRGSTTHANKAEKVIYKGEVKLGFGLCSCTTGHKHVNCEKGRQGKGGFHSIVKETPRDGESGEHDLSADGQNAHMLEVDAPELSDEEDEEPVDGTSDNPVIPDNSSSSDDSDNDDDSEEEDEHAFAGEDVPREIAARMRWMLERGVSPVDIANSIFRGKRIAATMNGKQDMNLQGTIDSITKYLSERYTTKVGGTYCFAALAIAHWLLTEVDKNRTDDDDTTPSVADIFGVLERGEGWNSKLQPGRYFIDIGTDHLQITVGANKVASAKILRVRGTTVGEQPGGRLHRTELLTLGQLLAEPVVASLQQESLDDLGKNINLLFPSTQRARARFISFTTEHALVIMTKPDRRGADLVYVKALTPHQRHGRAIMQQVLVDCAARRIPTLTVSLQACLTKARDFYSELGFTGIEEEGQLISMSIDIEPPLPECIEARGFQLSVTPDGWREYCDGNMRMEQLLVHEVQINGVKPLIVCVCDYAPFVDCAYGSRGWPAGLPRHKVPAEPDLTLNLVKTTVETVIDAELLKRHTTNDQHVVSAETIYDLLMENLEGKWVRAYIGVAPSAELTAVVIKRLQKHAASQSMNQSKLEELFKLQPTPDVDELFVGQRVWARWLADKPRGGMRAEGAWTKARVLGPGKAPMGNGDRSYTLYFDVDQEEHPKTPLRHINSDLISTTERS
jgi:hypothetical protein